MITELIASALTAGNYYPLWANQVAGSATGPSLAGQNVNYINQASTVVGLAADSASSAGDTTEIWHLIKNGITTLGSVTIVNGTKHGATTGLSAALVAGDYVSWQLDAGASAATGRTNLQAYITTP